MAKRDRKVLCIGIDPSIRSTGVVLLGNNTVKSKLFKTTSLANVGGIVEDAIRSEELSEDILSWLIQTIYSNDIYPLFVVEGPAFLRQKARSLQTGGVHCYIHNMIRKNFTMSFDMVVPPKTLKKFTTGNGNANKEKMKEVIKQKWNPRIIDSSDTYDAYALAEFGWHIFDNPASPYLEKVNLFVHCNKETSYGEDLFYDEEIQLRMLASCQDF